MSLPRSGEAIRPPRAPAVPARPSTQRLVLSGALGKTMPAPAPTGSINLPIGMILRSLPPEVLAADISEFENSGAAATEIALPMNAVINQLPTGKVEMPFQDLVAHFPEGFLLPAESIASYAGILVSLPLMDIVMRIPPDLLSVRPDQKDVDAAVTNMADPFTEESLREQAAARRAQGEANIVDESQVAPAEEFVPQETASSRAFVPPVRPTSMPTIRPSTPITRTQPSSFSTPTAGAGRPPISLPAKPMRPTAPIPAGTPPPPPVESAPTMPRPPLLSASQSLSASQAQAVPVPRPPAFRPATRPTTPVFSPPSAPPAESAPSRPVLPPIPSMAVPTLPVAASEPPVPAPAQPDLSSFAPTVPLPTSGTPSAPATTSGPLPPDANADDLQRLAALAMQEIGEEPGSMPAPAISKPAEDPASLPTMPLQPDQVVAATARLKLPEFPVRELAQTAPVTPPEPVRMPNRPELSRRSITTRVPAEETPPAPVPEPAPAPEAASGAVAINLNNCSAEDLLPIPGLGRELADAIVKHRAKIGEFRKLEDLLGVPGMTRAAYSNLTGETAPTGMHQSLNELLGFPAGQEVTLKDVTDRIACWPDVTGCLLSQNNGLVLVGTVPDSLDKQAIVAFAPRMFDELNKSFSEIAGKQTDDLIIPTTGTSFHILREKDLYLTILSRVPQMPERHMKIARYVLAGLSVRSS